MTDLTAPRIPVTTTYHGVEVTEDYRWLEDSSSEETIAWTKAQQAATRAHLDDLPWRAALRSRVEEVMRVESTSYSVLRGGSSVFALKAQPPKQQPFVVALTDLDDPATERVVVDPNEIDPSGETSIDFYVPSPDGSRVAVSLSEHGTEDGTLHVFDVATGEVVDEPIPHVNSGMSGGSMAWRADGAGFWYTRCADPEGFEQQVWFHEMGASDRLDLAGEFAERRIAENFLSSSPDGRWVLDWVQKGDGGEWQVFARSQDADGDWWQVAGLRDRCVLPIYGTPAIAGDVVFLLCRREAQRGKVLRLALRPRATVADAVVVLPEGDLDIEEVAATAGTLWVAYTDGGPQQLRSFAHDGTPREPVELPPASAVTSYAGRLTPVAPDRVAWPLDRFTEPTTWWLAVDGESPRPTAVRTTTPVDLSGYEVTREFATSKDGTRVPLHIIAAPGTPRDGSAATILYGYGGYGFSLFPGFHAAWLPWLERGGVYVIGNIRGGGEYGEAWHQGGRLTTKQNCFDDFIACADHLVESGTTGRDRLAVMGASNGGLLMTAVLTQRPDLARAVVAMVPVTDGLRAEIGPNGVYNITEFGTVEDPDQFAAMYAYSPYHRVVDGTAYPAVLLTASENDPRVESWHPKKMTARLQEATSSAEPVLLRMDEAGHGVHASLDQQVDELTDVYAFLFDRLGLGYADRSLPAR